MLPGMQATQMLGPMPTVFLKPKRIEYGKWLPIVFVSFTILGLYVVYVFYHCVPMMQLSVPPNLVNKDAAKRGFLELVIFHYLTAMLLFCYVKCIVTSAGQIPDNDPEWSFQPAVQPTASGWMPNFTAMAQEVKKSGERRHCKWCGKYKPDRCHHCRVCKVCILKMDHHCPWIYNCVGFHNYKTFFLLLFYAALDCHLIAWTLLESTQNILQDPRSPFGLMFIMLFAETLAFALQVTLTVFFGFHIYLMLQATTTIEFCEKKLPKTAPEGDNQDQGSIYNLGVLGNIRTALGPVVLTWLLPCFKVEGDGLHHATNRRLSLPHGLRRRNY